MMTRRVFSFGAGALCFSCFLPKGADAAAPFPSLHVDPEWRERLVSIRSSLDGTDQPAYFVAPKGRSRAPLFVGLHTWSYNLTAINHS